MSGHFFYSTLNGSECTLGGGTLEYSFSVVYLAPNPIGLVSVLPLGLSSSIPGQKTGLQRAFVCRPTLWVKKVYDRLFLPLTGFRTGLAHTAEEGRLVIELISYIDKQCLFS